MTVVRDDLESLEAGLDALETAPEARTSRGRKALSAAWPPVLALLLLLGVWQAVYASGIKEPYQLPSPLDVWAALKETASSGDLAAAVLNSLRRGGLGFLASVAIGTPLGLVLARVRPVRRMFGPLISGLQSLPSVA
ncbi:MAG: ABC transporter permease, partial [Actinobacteria bacterium]|nr:ABC transporter permease [Actinomycetota bacterium]